MPPEELTFGRLMLADLIATPLAAITGSILLFVTISISDPPANGVGGFVVGLLFFTLLASIIASVVIFVVLLILALPLTLALVRSGVRPLIRDGTLVGLAILIAATALLALGLDQSNGGYGGFIVGWFLAAYVLSSAACWVLALRFLSRGERVPDRIEERFQ